MWSNTVGFPIPTHITAVWTFAIPVWCQHFELGLDYLQDLHPFLVPFLMPVFHMFITGSDYLNLASTLDITFI